MKIYNKITTIFNETTGQWETISEDSFNYSGQLDLALAQQTQNGDAGTTPTNTGGNTTNNNQPTTESYEFEKQDPAYGEKWKDENIKEYKEALFDRISQLLIENFIEIEPYIGGGTLKSLQKTIRDHEIKAGVQSEGESIVIYQSDSEANDEDKLIMDHIVQHFNFIHPMRINLQIQVMTPDVDDMPDYIKLILINPDVNNLDINALVGEWGLENLKLKDNVSQFFEIPQIKTMIDTNKLPEYEETTFTEIKPETE